MHRREYQRITGRHLGSAARPFIEGFTMPAFADRRQFLVATAADAAALTPTTLQAIETIERTAGHHFKFSLAAYSHRELFGTGP